MISKTIHYVSIHLLIILWGLLFGSLDAKAVAGSEIVDRIVAVVNDDIITYLELQKELQPYEHNIEASAYSPENEEKMRYKVRNEILNRMIDDTLTQQEARKNNITISEAEIDENIEKIKSANMWTDETFREALKREGMTMEEYRASLKKSAIRARLVNSAVKSAIVVTNEDIRSYYDDHAAEYAGELKYHLKHITLRVPPGSDDAGKQRMLQKMNKIYDELKSGKSFETLTDKVSEASSGLIGGDLGFIAFADISEALQNAVKHLSIGEFTPVIETDRGFQIFYVADIARIGGKTFEEARAEIEQKLYNELVDEKFRTWLEDLRKNAHIKIIQ
jgi:peptidyl-prolyl cis-trans isomerase SurA